MPAHVAITFGTPIFPNTTAAESTAEVECDPTAEPSESTASENGEDGMTSAEALILQWGQQIVTLSGHPEFKVELASKRKRRTRAKL
jgi:hypothetical protein